MGSRPTISRTSPLPPPSGMETMAAPLLIAWPYAAVSFLGIPANRDDMAGIRIAAAICRRVAYVLMAYGMIAVPFSFMLSAHMVLDYPGAARVWT